ncbi:MAG: hypothetical protein ABL949_01580 [Fimbriimonadaceae bacterium]
MYSFGEVAWRLIELSDVTELLHVIAVDGVYERDVLAQFVTAHIKHVQFDLSGIWPYCSVLEAQAINFGNSHLFSGMDAIAVGRPAVMTATRLPILQASYEPFFRHDPSYVSAEQILEWMKECQVSRIALAGEYHCLIEDLAIPPKLLW